MGDIIAADQNARSQSDANCDALTPPCPQPPVSKVLKAYFANKTEKSTLKGKTTIVDVSFEKINSAIVGATTWIIVETSELKSGTVTVEILGSDKEVLVAVDAALTVLEDGTEKTSLSGSVGNWSAKTDYANAATLSNKVIFEIKLRPKADETFTTWRTDIGKQTPKKSSFHLKVTATGGNATEYNCEDDTLKSPNEEKGIFYNQKDHWFGLFGCFCDKDFEVWEMKKIYPKSKLFSGNNCPLPEADRTFERFTEEINKAMKAYDINTCLRKAHFLGQADGETNLDTTLEHANGWDYDVSTHKEGHDKYKLYFDYTGKKPNPYEEFNTKPLSRNYDRYNECMHA